MREIKVRVHKSSDNLKKENQLAWKIAEIASDKSSPGEDCIDMVINRIIDNASLRKACINSNHSVSAGDMTLVHPRREGSTRFNINSKIKSHFEC